ncbi:MAG: tripartite tricarboxylate transporter substrate binding protein [Bdellovibrionales bacterium]|nr:tripartite tricarboxylate transporter substrate binding protein [Bdellovibrionales bacterium]
MLKKVVLSLLLMTCANISLAENFPEEPIHIIVYTAPGGLIDVTARKLANIIQRDLVKVPVVVENKSGAGGVVALNYLSTKPSDGYTIFGFTSSVVSKSISAKQEDLLKNLFYLALVAEDYEALITSKKSGLLTLENIKTHANNSNRPQVWVGPASGGTDHIFALKVWDQLKLNINWIPYKSGGEAIAALMGGHGSVYVGNPSDIEGKPDLQIAAVSSPERLKNFSDAPTFKELGYDNLTGESLWRGFAVQKDTPDEVKTKLVDLFSKAVATQEWKNFAEQSNFVDLFKSGNEFEQLVMQQIDKDKIFLSKTNG